MSFSFFGNIYQYKHILFGLSKIIVYICSINQKQLKEMKKIIINHYPSSMTFKVRKELPEFTFNCPVRNKILHYQLKKQNIDSPCHGYTEYGVDCIETFEGGEFWEIGS